MSVNSKKISSSSGSRSSGASGKILDFSKSIEKGAFGVLYTMTKGNTFPRVLTLISLVIEFIQLVSFGFKKVYPWGGDIGHYLRLIISPISHPSVELSYDAYTILFWVAIGLISLGFLNIWYIAYEFYRGKIANVWLIRTLRWFVSFSVAVLYIPILSLFLMGLVCDDGELDRFPGVLCFGNQNLPISIFAIIYIILFTIIAATSSMTYYEYDSSVKNRFSKSHARFDITILLVKTIFAFFYELLTDYPWVLAIVYFIGMLWCLFGSIVFIPYSNQMLNQIKSGFYGSVFWISICTIITLIVDNTSSPVTSYLVVVGIIPAFAGGYFGCRFYYKYLTLKVNELVYKDSPNQSSQSLGNSNSNNNNNSNATTNRTVKFEENQLGSRHEIKFSFFEKRYAFSFFVEIMARSILRKKDPESIDRANYLYQAGLQYFPESSLVWMAYANFLFSVRKDRHIAYAALEKLRRMNPPFDVRFFIFRHDKEREQLMDSELRGPESGKIQDFVSYMEFKKLYLSARKSHLSCLNYIRRFWRHLLHETIDLQRLSKLSGKIADTETKATDQYERLLSLNPSSVRVMRDYALFMEEVVKDNDRAYRLRTKADSIEDHMSKSISTEHVKVLSIENNSGKNLDKDSDIDDLGLSGGIPLERLDIDDNVTPKDHSSHHSETNSSESSKKHRRYEAFQQSNSINKLSWLMIATTLLCIIFTIICLVILRNQMVNQKYAFQNILSIGEAAIESNNVASGFNQMQQYAITYLIQSNNGSGWGGGGGGSGRPTTGSTTTTGGATTGSQTTGTGIPTTGTGIPTTTTGSATTGGASTTSPSTTTTGGTGTSTNSSTTDSSTNSTTTTPSTAASTTDATTSNPIIDFLNNFTTTTGGSSGGGSGGNSTTTGGSTTGRPNGGGGGGGGGGGRGGRFGPGGFNALNITKEQALANFTMISSITERSLNILENIHRAVYWGETSTSSYVSDKMSELKRQHGIRVYDIGSRVFEYGEFNKTRPATSDIVSDNYDEPSVLLTIFLALGNVGQFQPGNWGGRNGSWSGGGGGRNNSGDYLSWRNSTVTQSYNAWKGGNLFVDNARAMMAPDNITTFASTSYYNPYFRFVSDNGPKGISNMYFAIQEALILDMQNRTDTISFDILMFWLAIFVFLVLIGVIFFRPIVSRISREKIRTLILFSLAPRDLVLKMSKQKIKMVNMDSGSDKDIIFDTDEETPLNDKDQDSDVEKEDDENEQTSSSSPPKRFDGIDGSPKQSILLSTKRRGSIYNSKDAIKPLVHGETTDDIAKLSKSSPLANRQQSKSNELDHEIDLNGGWDGENKRNINKKTLRVVLRRLHISYSVALFFLFGFITMGLFISFDRVFVDYYSGLFVYRNSKRAVDARILNSMVTRLLSPRLMNDGTNEWMKNITEEFQFNHQSLPDIANTRPLMDGTYGCWMVNQSQCRPTTDPYYSDVKLGLDWLVDSFILHSLSLQSLEISQAYPNNTDIKWITEIGNKEIIDGLDRASFIYFEYWQDIQTTATTVITAVMSVTAVILLLFYLFVFRPFINRLKIQHIHTLAMLRMAPEDIRNMEISDKIIDDD